MPHSDQRGPAVHPSLAEAGVRMEPSRGLPNDRPRATARP